MFPQVAPKFFATRAEGPKNVGKEPARSRPRTGRPAVRQADDGKAADHAGPSPTRSQVGDKSHKVTVEPA